MRSSDSVGSGHQFFGVGSEAEPGEVIAVGWVFPEVVVVARSKQVGRGDDRLALVSPEREGPDPVRKGKSVLVKCGRR